MFLLRVTPLTPLPPTAPPYFTYFSTDPVPEGAIVEVELKKRKVNGFVQETLPLQQEKAAAKKAPFLPKKIIGVVCTTPFISTAQRELSVWLSEFYLTSLSTALLNFFYHGTGKTSQPKDSKFLDQTLTPADPRWDLDYEKGSGFSYSFSPRLEPAHLALKPVLILTPTQWHRTYYQKLLETHALPYLVWPTAASKAKDAFVSVRNNLPLIIVGSKNAVYAPFSKLAQIVLIEESNAQQYKEWFRSPHVDYRRIARQLAVIFNVPLFIIDTFPSPTILQLSADNLIQPKLELPKIKTYVFHNKLSTAFFKDSIPKTRARKTIIWIAHRAPHAPFDAQQITTIVSALEKTLPEYRVIPVATETSQHLSKVFQEFALSQRAILVGTDYLWKPHLPPTDLGIILNANTLLAASDSLLLEKLWRMIVFLYSKGKKVCLHTPNPNNPLLSFFKEGTYPDWTLQERRKFNLPPFTRIIRFSLARKDPKSAEKKLVQLKRDLEAMIASSSLANRANVSEIMRRGTKILKSKRSRFALELIVKLPNDGRTMPNLKELATRFAVDPDVIM